MTEKWNALAIYYKIITHARPYSSFIDISRLCIDNTPYRSKREFRFYTYGIYCKTKLTKRIYQWKDVWIYHCFESTMVDRVFVQSMNWVEKLFILLNLGSAKG